MNVLIWTTSRNDKREKEIGRGTLREWISRINFNFFFLYSTHAEMSNLSVQDKTKATDRIHRSDGIIIKCLSTHLIR